MEKKWLFISPAGKIANIHNEFVTAMKCVEPKVRTSHYSVIVGMNFRVHNTILSLAHSSSGYYPTKRIMLEACTEFENG